MNYQDVVLTDEDLALLNPWIRHMPYNNTGIGLSDGIGTVVRKIIAQHIARAKSEVLKDTADYLDVAIGYDDGARYTIGILRNRAKVIADA